MKLLNKLIALMLCCVLLYTSVPVHGAECLAPKSNKADVEKSLSFFQQFHSDPRVINELLDICGLDPEDVYTALCSGNSKWLLVKMNSGDITLFNLTAKNNPKIIPVSKHSEKYDALYALLKGQFEKENKIIAGTENMEIFQNKAKFPLLLLIIAGISVFAILTIFVLPPVWNIFSFDPFVYSEIFSDFFLNVLHAETVPSSLMIQIFMSCGAVSLFIFSLLGYWIYSVIRNREWTTSKSASDVKRIWQYRNEGNISGLQQITDHARERHLELIRAINDAVSNNESKVGGIPINRARHYAVYDLIVQVIADLALIQLVRDSGKRLTGLTPEEWTRILDPLEKEAIKTGSEKGLFEKILMLRSELRREQDMVMDFQDKISRFASLVPSVFGGGIAAVLKDANAVFGDFQLNEFNEEKNIYNSKNSAMRGRVSDKLYVSSHDFKVRRDHRDDLSGLIKERINPVVETAEQIDEDIMGVITNRTLETAMMALAESAAHTPVPETTRDSKGNTTTTIVIKDLSAPYRMLANYYSSEAVACAEQANQGLAELKKLMILLVSDPRFITEKMESLLPLKEKITISENFTSAMNLFFDPIFSIFTGISEVNSATKARNRFLPVLTALININDEAIVRYQKESNWVDNRITEDLYRQIDRRVDPEDVLPEDNIQNSAHGQRIYVVSVSQSRSNEFILNVKYSDGSRRQFDLEGLESEDEIQEVLAELAPKPRARFQSAA